MNETKLRVFGGKDDKSFWADKPMSPANPNFKTNWIKKLFCKHNYTRSGAVFASTGCVILTCQKCGKTKRG